MTTITFEQKLDIQKLHFKDVAEFNACLRKSREAKLVQIEYNLAQLAQECKAGKSVGPFKNINDLKKSLEN